MKVISIINYKGGVGKTTITANLAAEMTFRGKKVLVIDLDPQTNLTFSFLKVDEWSECFEKDKTIKFWFDSIIDGKKDTPSFNDLIISKDNIDILCSHLGLIDVDFELAVGLSSGSDRQYHANYIKTYSYIRNELQRLDKCYDVILFDCPPNFGIVTKNALIASDYYVVPAKMDYLSTLGINYLRNHVNRLVKDYNAHIEHLADRNAADMINPKFLGVIATMVSLRNGDPIAAQKAYVEELSRSNIALFDNMVRLNNTVFASAPQYGTPVVMNRYTQGSTYSDIVVELESLTTEFMTKTGIQ